MIRSTLLTTPLVCAVILLSKDAFAAPIVFEADVPADNLDHFFVDFDVPEGTKEIEIKHDDLAEENILDFGLLDPDGYRGWGGGTTEPVVINEQAASRAYVPGPLTVGKWRVVVGKAKIKTAPGRYHIEVDLKQTATLAPTVPRSAYVPKPALKTETRYYAGDLHVHSRESTDAEATLEQNIALAKQRGLDWIEISDHNTITQLDFFNDVQDKEGFLLLPGIEYTTYAGHANAVGATKWVDHKIGQPGVTIAGAIDAIRDQGAVFSINHPVLDIGDLCIGCAWNHEVDATKIGGVEIATLGLSAGGNLFSERALKFWDDLLDKGSHAAALGGSDDHRAGTSSPPFPAKIGAPTTLVRATELSAKGILDGIKKGATVVKLEGPDDPMVELEVATAKGGTATGFPGDTIGARAIVLRATITKGSGNTVRFVKNGQPEDSVSITSDPFVYQKIIKAPATGEERWRAEALIDDKPRTVTSHVWLKLDPAGPEAAEPAAEDDGCATTSRSSSSNNVFALVLALASLIVLRARAKR